MARPISGTQLGYTDSSLPESQSVGASQAARARDSAGSGTVHSTSGQKARLYSGSNDGGSLNDDRRRFARVPLNLDALIAIDGGPRAACTVRDFCLGGMFVSLDPRVHSRILPPIPAVLFLGSIVGAGRPDHGLRLTVVRKVSNGIGVAFDNPDAVTLELLTNLAARNGTLRSSQPPGPGKRGALPPEYARIAARLTELVKSEIRDVCADFLDRVDDALFSAARNAGSNLAEVRFLDGQREMRRLRDRLITEVLSLVDRALTGLENPLADAGHRGNALELSDLSLVEVDEFEEFLLVSKVVAELEPELREPLDTLQKRFSSLASRELDVSSIPIGPAALCYAVAESLRGLELGLDVTSCIYGALRNVMSGSLGQLYAAVNDFFVAEGVQLAVEPDTRRASAATSQLGNPGAPPGAISPPPPQRDLQTTQTMPKGLGLAGAPLSPRNVHAAPMQRGPMATRTSTTQPNVPPSREVYTLPDGWSTPRASQAAPNLQLALQTALTQMDLRRNLGPVPQGTGLAPGNDARSNEIRGEALRGLARIQRSADRAGQLGHLDPDRLKDLIVDALGTDGSDLSPVYGEVAQILELVANLFHALLQDPLIAGGAKAHLSRLQPLVHRAALGDPEFFSANDHPVRELIGRVARVGDGRGEANERLALQVGMLLAKANLAYEGDAKVLKAIVQELDRILADQVRESERHAKTLLASSALQSARDMYADAKPDSTQQADKTPDLPNKESKWLKRSRALEVGQRVHASLPPGDSRAMSLIWKRADSRFFAFADPLAEKPILLPLHQVAAYLQRGVFKVLDDGYEKRALDRAMLGAVDRLHAQFESQTTRDPLTGFLNERAFVDRVGLELGKLKGSAVPGGALCHISIENLEQVSEAYGVATANALIRAFSEALAASVRDQDPIFARLGSSELGVFWPKGGLESAHSQLKSALGDLRTVSVDSSALAHPSHSGPAPHEASRPAPFDAADTLVRPVTPEFVIGLCESDNPNEPLAETLLVAAKDACADARREGIGSIRIGGAQQALRQQFARMIAYTGEALARDALTLFGQRIFSLSNGDLPPALRVAVGARDFSGNAIPTRIFMRALARCEHASSVDLWAFKNTLQWLLDREDEAERFAFAIVPLSAASLRDEQLSDRIVAELMQTPVPPGKICFEIPDREIVDNRAAIRELVDSLKVVGCRFVLDEFGSGHKSYDYIKEIDVDYVTVRSAFVKNAPQNQADLAMAKSINELVHFAGKKTLAKQESGADLAAAMREIGIDFIHDLTDRISIRS